MTSQNSWRIVAAGSTAGGAADTDTPLIQCPRGHERRASRQERTESVVWCEKCGQSYQIDWSPS